jgi:hypothetical protein
VAGLADAEELEVDARYADRSLVSAAIAVTPSRGTVPSGTWVFSGAMSIWSKRFSRMKRRYEWMLSGGIGKYSSRLKVTTSRKESPSSR